MILKMMMMIMTMTTGKWFHDNLLQVDDKTSKSLFTEAFPEEEVAVGESRASLSLQSDSRRSFHNHNNVGNGNNNDNDNDKNNDENNDNNNQLTTGGSEGPVTDNHLNVLNKTSLWFSSSIICDSKNYFSLIIRNSFDCSKTPEKYSGSSSQSKFMKLHLSSSPPPKTEQNNMFWKIFEDKSLLHHYQILGYPL